MEFEDCNQLLDPGYLPFESGYKDLAGGKKPVAALTRMPGCRAKMVHWRFDFLGGIKPSFASLFVEETLLLWFATSAPRSQATARRCLSRSAMSRAIAGMPAVAELKEGRLTMQ